MKKIDRLISYPRSGNHWVRFIVEWFSGRPTLGCRGNTIIDTPIYANLVEMGLDSPLSHVDPALGPILEKSHSQNFFPGNNFAGKIVFILRNPKEVIIRQTGSYDKPNLSSWAELLEVFHAYQQPKHIIYYEDLLQKPEEVIPKLLTFLELPHDDIPKFFENFNKLKDESVGIYDNTDKVTSGAPERRSVTKGKDLLFHSKSYSLEERKSVDKFFKNNHPGILDYIKRFLE